MWLLLLSYVSQGCSPLGVGSIMGGQNWRHVPVRWVWGSGVRSGNRLSMWRKIGSDWSCVETLPFFGSLDTSKDVWVYAADPGAALLQWQLFDYVGGLVKKFAVDAV
jgi:hypothetical protein